MITGFRLDSTFTLRQHAGLSFESKPLVTKRSDYVNTYPAVLQTASYNFTGTSTSEEYCVGVVKAQGIHAKIHNSMPLTLKC